MSDSLIETDYGYDLIWADTENYNCRIIVFNDPTNKIPIGFHKHIEKTWFVNNGNFRLKIIETHNGTLVEKDLKEGSVFHIPPLTPVGIECLSAGASITQCASGDPSEDFYQIIPN